MEQYDIFISYRRTSYETANLIATRLRAAGYSVFFDMETLRSGKFNEQLFSVIENCKDFILVLPPDALDRCVDEDDWVRLEVCKAMECEKNIIPVMLNGFAWPNPMPKGMEELQHYQALAANSIEYFDMSIERLQKRYLKSRPHVPIVKFAKMMSLWIVSILIILGIVYGVFYFLSLNVCQKYATIITNDASGVHIIVTENKSLHEDWEKYVEALRHEGNPEKVIYLRNDILGRIAFTEKTLKESWMVDSVPVQIGDWHAFLLSFHGINAEEIAISPVFATSYYKDYLELLSSMRNAVLMPNTYNFQYVDVMFDALPHMYNAYYATVLSELSHFPQKALLTYKELSSYWTYFPKHYKQGEEAEYYEEISESEMKQTEDLLNKYSKELEKGDAYLQDLERKTEQMEKGMQEAFEKLEEDIANRKVQADAELQSMQRSNEEELALRKEKVGAKKVQLEASKAELEELDRQYVEAYEGLKAKCTIEENDDQWYKWGKIRRWGMFLNTVVESRKNLEKQGIYSTSSIKPEVVYADLSAQLSVYQTHHPETKEYVSAAREFFKSLSKGKRSYAGVVVFGFKDDMKHPVLQKGDIIVEYDNVEIKSYEDFKAAYKTNKEGTVSFQRLVDGKFVDMETTNLRQTDIIGFLELTE